MLTQAPNVKAATAAIKILKCARIGQATTGLLAVSRALLKRECVCDVFRRQSVAVATVGIFLLRPLGEEACPCLALLRAHDR